MTIAKVRRPITSERSTDTVVVSDPPTPRSYSPTPPPPYFGGGVFYARRTNEPPLDTLGSRAYVARDVERPGSPGSVQFRRFTADPPPNTLSPVAYTARDAERHGSPGSVQSLRSVMDPLPEGFEIRSTHVQEAERPGPAGSVFHTFLPGAPPVALPPTLAPVAYVVREANRPGEPGSATWSSSRYPDLPGPVAFRNVNVIRESERPGHTGATLKLGFAPPEEPTPRIPTFVQSPFLRPPTGSVRVSSSLSGGGMLVSLPRVQFVAVPIPAYVGAGGVLNPRRATDPPPPPNLPHGAVIAGAMMGKCWGQYCPISSRTSSVPGSQAPMPQAFVVGRGLPHDGEMMGPTLPIISRMRTISIEQRPRVVLVQESWFPWRLRVPVQASAPMRFGLLVAPSIPDAMFEAEPSAKLVDNFRSGGWPVFKARK